MTDPLCKKFTDGEIEKFGLKNTCKIEESRDELDELKLLFYQAEKFTKTGVIGGKILKEKTKEMFGEVNTLSLTAYCSIVYRKLAIKFINSQK